MKNTSSVYVQVGEKGGYQLGIRYPTLMFGGAHFRIHSTEGKSLDVVEVSRVFSLDLPKVQKSDKYLSFDYRLLGTTKAKVQTALVDMKSIAHDSSGVELLFEQFIDFLESQEVTLDGDAALNVYLDTLYLELTSAGFYPPKGKAPAYIEPLTVEVGGRFFKLGE